MYRFIILECVTSWYEVRFFFETEKVYKVYSCDICVVVCSRMAETMRVLTLGMHERYLNKHISNLP